MCERKVTMLTCERIDDEICGHAVYAGDQRCPTCGRRLSMLEAQRNLGSLRRRLCRVVMHDAAVLLRAVYTGKSRAA